MEQTLSVFWWISAVELPALAALFGIVMNMKGKFAEEMDDVRRNFELKNAQVKEMLSSYKVEVAKTYASLEALKDLENRLTSHLLRIEQKLDYQAGVK